MLHADLDVLRDLSEIDMVEERVERRLAVILVETMVSAAVATVLLRMTRSNAGIMASFILTREWGSRRG